MTTPVDDLEPAVAYESAEAVEEQSTGKVIEGRSPWQIARLRYRRDKTAMVALVVCVVVIIVAILAPLMKSLGWINPYKFNYNLVGGVGSMPLGHLGGASWAHPLGVEPGTGRDVLSRVLLGITFSLTIAFAATLVSIVIGGILGIIAGYMGHRTDFWVSRTMDLVLAFPQLLMLLALSPVLQDRITALGVPAGTPTKAVYLIIVIGFFGWPYFGRLVRGQVLTLRNREFVEAARSLGAKRTRIWRKELLPNLWAPLLVYATLTLPANISAEAALSFLGVGLQAPTPSLGNILNNSVNYLDTDPMFFYAPGIALVLIVLSFNLVGDGLRDALDPKSTR